MSAHFVRRSLLSCRLPSVSSRSSVSLSSSRFFTSPSSLSPLSSSVRLFSSNLDLYFPHSPLSLQTKHHQRVSKKTQQNNQKISEQNLRKKEEKKHLKSKEDFQCVTFYKLKEIPSHKFSTFVSQAQEILDQKKYRIYGTLLVSPEGVNAQFAFPVKFRNQFFKVFRQIDPDFFKDIEEVVNYGDIIENVTETDVNFPFRKIKVKAKKVTLPENFEGASLDYTNNGESISPEQWHSELTVANPPLLLDCRNDFESDLGTFKGALPLNTSTFNSSADALKSILRDVKKDQRILTFCTGGIRCEKVNAYLYQHLGFTNIAKLEKGIVAYENWAKTLPDPESSLFKGENFAFDRRRLTDENSARETGSV